MRRSPIEIQSGTRFCSLSIRGGGVEEVHRVIRRKGDRYDDFRMFPNDIEGKVVFLGGKDYLPLFFQADRKRQSEKDRIFQLCERATP
jgi:hypothetical protein